MSKREWTSIDKKWPPIREPVLVYTETDNIIEAYIDKWGDFYYMEVPGKRLKVNVVAWMPKPEYDKPEVRKEYNYGPWLNIGV